MRNHSFLIIVIFVSTLCNAQFGSQQIISTEAGLPVRAVTGDINGDGTIDVATASRSPVSSNISWYSNLGGLGNFSEINAIGVLIEARGIDLSDLDGDGDLDVLATTPDADLLVWYENIDGRGNFNSQNIIATSIGNAMFCLAKDMDGDTIPDVIVSADIPNTITWYKNDGNGNFSTPVLVGNQGNNGRFFDISDFDNDGDLDIVSTSSATEILTWYENIDGLGNFSSPKIINDNMALATSSVKAADIDGDTFIDIVTTSAGDNRVSWYKNNLDTNNSFSNEIIISAIDSPRPSFVVDIDNDGDNDVLYASGFENGIVGWFENLDGIGTFSEHQIIGENVFFGRGVNTGDLDNDGDQDVLLASQNDDTIAWYENLTILSVLDFEENLIRMYPNPASDAVNIELLDVNAPSYTVTLTNSLGQRLATYNQSAFVNNRATISVAGLANGIYFVTVEAGKAIKTMKLVVE